MPKQHNQDASLVVRQLAGRPDAFLLGVFDGHGAYGHDVSGYLKDHMEESILRSLKSSDLSNPELVISAIQAAYRSLAAGIRTNTIDSVHSGSTSVTVVIIGDLCICSNVGDSRAVLLRSDHSRWLPVPLSEDHKPEVEEERARILQRGGVIAPQTNSSGPLRVWLPGEQAPGLAMTRSMGDTLASKIGVTSDPEIREIQLTSQDKALILASDGVWEVLSNEEVAGILKDCEGNSAEYTAQRVVEEAVGRWDGRTVDDVTAVVVWM